MEKGININYISNNENSIIVLGGENIIINGECIQTDTYDKTAFSPIDWSIRKNKNMAAICPMKRYARNSLERAMMIERYLMEILFYSYKEGMMPTLRLYGHFSPFSTIKSQYSHADIDILELSEKRLLMEWAKFGYPVKVIISLQTGLICEMSYTIDQYNERCEDLCTTLRKLEKFSNVEFVIDDTCVWDSLYISDTLFYCAAGNDKLDKHSATYVSSDFIPTKQLVENKIRAFERRFRMLQQKNRLERKKKGCLYQERYIYDISQHRKNIYLEEK